MFPVFTTQFLYSRLIMKTIKPKFSAHIIASTASNHWLRVIGLDKQLQSVRAQILSVDFLNGLYLSKYLLPTLKILDLGGD